MYVHIYIHRETCMYIWTVECIYYVWSKSSDNPTDGVTNGHKP